MKLYYSHTSPYARKCRIALELCGLKNKTKLLLTDPLNDDTYRETNPLGKVPALVDNTLTLFDSPLICEYIDVVAQTQDSVSTVLFPKTSPSYFHIQLAHATANGILDAAVLTVMERRRTTEHSSYWIKRWHNAIQSSISTVQDRHLGDDETVHIATIAFATALAYLDFRLPDYPWRNWNKELAVWFNEVKEKHWMISTQPI